MALCIGPWLLYSFKAQDSDASLINSQLFKALLIESPWRAATLDDLSML